jgi:hypothetical protein
MLGSRAIKKLPTPRNLPVTFYYKTGGVWHKIMPNLVQQHEVFKLFKQARKSNVREG